MRSMLQLNEEEARAFLRKVIGPPRRVLVSNEHDQMMLLLSLAEPFNSFNNQNTWTDQYLIGDTQYEVIYGTYADPTIEEILPKK